VQSQTIMDPNEVHYELSLQYGALRQWLLLQVSFKDIKGHQDTGQTTLLSQEAWMNIEMDKHAKQKVSLDGPYVQLWSIPYKVELSNWREENHQALGGST